MYYAVDPKLKKHLRKLSQVFIYITDECNLRCQQCLYKPDLTFHLKEKEIPLAEALALIADLKELGASKLTIMGGEPTLYGHSQGNKPLLTLIKRAKDLGYEYVRIDTNGQFDPQLLTNKDFHQLDEITFSLDAPTPEINDPVRGKGSFKKCVANIKKAIAYGYNVDVTCCLHKNLLKRDKQGKLPLDSMIRFVESLGVKRVNFHDLFKSGIPRDTWTGELAPSFKEWEKVYSQIQENIKSGHYTIHVRMPQCFVSQEEFKRNQEYYGYCPAKLGERVLIHPNGQIRICSLMIGTPYCVAKFYARKIVWEEGPTNELRDHQLDQSTPCTNQNKGEHFGGLVPLCVSFKPKQKELIWERKLGWESKRRMS